MIVGVPKEVKNNEKRVPILPFGVEDLVKSGHKVIVETMAGIGSGFSDELYEKYGATIVSKAEEVFFKSELMDLSFFKVSLENTSIFLFGYIFFKILIHFNIKYPWLNQN